MNERGNLNSDEPVINFCGTCRIIPCMCIKRKKMTQIVVMCADCTEKEITGKSLSQYANDFTEYYSSIGLEFLGCDHLSMVEKDRK